MRRIDEIVDDVEARLRQNPTGVKARRAKVEKLAKIRNEWTRPGADGSHARTS